MSGLAYQALKNEEQEATFKEQLARATITAREDPRKDLDAVQWHPCGKKGNNAEWQNLLALSYEQCKEDYQLRKAREQSTGRIRINPEAPPVKTLLSHEGDIIQIGKRTDNDMQHNKNRPRNDGVNDVESLISQNDTKKMKTQHLPPEQTEVKVKECFNQDNEVGTASTALTT